MVKIDGTPVMTNPMHEFAVGAYPLSPMERPITVVIADDHGLVRRGTREILEQEPTLAIVGEASSGAELVDLIAACQPDVALVDVGMPDMSGIDALERIKAEWPHVAVLVLSIHDDIEYVWKAIQAGASGYLTKDVSDRHLIDAVLTVATGGTALAPHLTSGLVGQVRDAAHSAEKLENALTDRELEVLERVARGHSNKAIAADLSLSPRTVEVHLTHVFKKLRAESRTHAVMLAARRGLIRIDDGGG